MSDNKALFIEEAILSAIKGLLARRVNELLMDYEFQCPVIEFGNYQNEKTVTPEITISICEKTEKERIIRLDAYTVTIGFTFADQRDTPVYAYAFNGVINKALAENQTLDGIADFAVITSQKITPPKKPHCGEDWRLDIALRVTVEGMYV
jgi:hypothetical protein